MPLIIVSGYPASGKSTVTDALVAHVEATRPDTKITTIRDSDSATFSKDLYRDSSKEKEHRGYLRSLTQKALTDHALVVVDSLNYIKGYRYELYCLAKLVKTTYCVLFCDASKDTVRQFNDERENSEEKYPEEVLDQLIQRFEAPEGRHRWDSPLFTVHPTPADKRLPDLDLIKEISEYVFGGARLQSNQSTQSQPISATNFLYELDSLTQNIVRSLMEAQKGAVPGDQLAVCGTDQKVVMKTEKSLGELTRMKRQFIAYAKTHPITDQAKLAAMFVNFINNS